MANVYPDSFHVLQPMLPIVRKALIHELDSLRVSICSSLDSNCFASASGLLDQMKMIHEFIDELDKCIQFDDDEEAPF